MKKVISIFILILLSINISISASAEFEMPPIIDEAGYLTESEIDELTDRMMDLREKYDFDVAIYTEASMLGVDAMNTADDTYDYLGYGAGNGADGILLYVSDNPREYWFSTHGYGMTAFNDNGLAYLEKKILPSLKKDNYYEAFSSYVDYADELLEMAKNGEPFNKKQYSKEFVLFVILGALLIPLLVGYLLMKKKLKMMKTAVSQDYAGNYIKPGSMNITYARDFFVYSRIDRTEKEKSSSSSHTSSSGETHGGRGGSF